MTYHTNIKHQELVAILGSRNLYLRLVYAHIANYTQVKGAWCGSQRDLAAQLELPIATVSNQLTELINRGLIVRDANTYRSAHEQKCSAGEQIRSAHEQNTDPINYINKMKENEYIARAQLRTAQAPTPDSFELLFKAFTLRVGNIKLADSMRDDCQRMWSTFPDWKRKMLIDKVNSGEWIRPRFDWLIGDFNPQPEFRKGDEDEDLVQVRYNGAYKICTRQTMEQFNLEFVKNWN